MGRGDATPRQALTLRVPIPEGDPEVDIPFAIVGEGAYARDLRPAIEVGTFRSGLPIPADHEEGQTVIHLIAGKRPRGYSIRVERVWRKDDELSVQVALLSPGPGRAGGNATSYPTLSIRVDTSALRGARWVRMCDGSGTEMASVQWD